LGAGGGGGLPGYGLTGEAMIIPDEVNNALVIRANAADYARIKKTIDTLDILPRAVLIEVMILEVRLGKNMQYGVEWLFKSGDFKAVFNNKTARTNLLPARQVLSIVELPPCIILTRTQGNHNEH
jgi:type II secretory pathway component GspD/PulD (secretin)